jgi:xylulose-5-phosphate/fructose-6-phosphate phosphoketolase
MNILPADDQITAFGPARATIQKSVLSAGEIERMDAYWRATLYLSLGMIYLRENPLLREPLQLAHTKKRLLGHWGSDPGLSLIYVHLNRLIKKYDLNMLYVAGPGHGAPGILSNVYLEGTYSEVYPEKSQDIEGMRRLFRSFSFPGGIGSHCTPELPGSLHEGGELGYSLSHAYGIAFDHPDLITVAVVGDGEAETGPLATAWHSNKFLNPRRDGAVLPVLHLNGYKINNPTLLARISHRELENLFIGYGYRPYFVEGSEHDSMHQAMAATLEHCVEEIREIQAQARKFGSTERPVWPMVVLRSPKGWTCPAEIDGHKAEGSWRAHQVPIKDVAKHPEDLRVLEQWLRSYRPEELFDQDGRLREELRALAPEGTRRMGSNPIANGGTVRKPLRLPDINAYAVAVTQPGTVEKGNTLPLGEFLRDILRMNPENFRVFGPDETASNKLDAVYEASPKTWMAERFPEDEDEGFLGPEGRVMEMLSEHTLEGWLEGYLLSGRHGLLASYEAFVHVIDSMVNQHCKWLEISRELAWRAPVSSLNLLITSTVWRQDHNGFTHQDPGFIDVVANKSAKVTRIYLPPDANCLLAVSDHCLRSVDYVNVIVSDKQVHLQYLGMEAAIRHCARGLGIWEWASTDDGREPDVVFVGCGDIATQEALAATSLLREDFPDLAIRFINVVDLFRLEPDTEHPHGLSDPDFDGLFTTDKPVIFNFHGYPWLIHRLTYRRKNHRNIHVRGYKEKGNINTPMELAICNETDRYSLAIDAIDRTPKLSAIGAHAKARYQDQQDSCRSYAHEEGTDRDEIIHWKWEDKAGAQ